MFEHINVTTMHHLCRVVTGVHSRTVLMACEKLPTHLLMCVCAFRLVLLFF